MEDTVFSRRASRGVQVGNVKIGDFSPISVQSMTNTDPMDYEKTLKQVEALANAGCDVIRLALPTEGAVETVARIKKSGVKTPLVADIHFDYRIALAAVRAGIDKIRINPGNIGDKARVRAVADACRAAGIPIRIGVNSGSLEKHILEKYGAPTSDALAESALYHAELLEDAAFSDILISVKASSVPDMIAANRILAKETSYPLHLGVTEAGSPARGITKSAVGIGTLLAEGIGDTVRVSLTADPMEEIGAARAILSALGLFQKGEMDIISCPTCGRTRFDLIPLLSQFEWEVDRLSLRSIPIKVAFMGCVVNGPGEAREADIGVAGGMNEGIIFRRGVKGERVPADRIVSTLISEILKMKDNRHA